MLPLLQHLALGAVEAQLVQTYLLLLLCLDWFTEVHRERSGWMRMFDRYTTMQQEIRACIHIEDMLILKDGANVWSSPQSVLRVMWDVSEASEHRHLENECLRLPSHKFILAWLLGR
nr:hypothetical protein CFP56_01310 [Quercus suber]